MGEEGPKGDPGEKVSLNLYTNLKDYNIIVGDCPTESW